MIDPRIARNGGRIFSAGGDSVLAEFPCARAAFESACAIQREMAGAAAAREALLAKVPAFSAARFVAGRPFQFTQDREPWREGLRKGGLAA